MTFVDEQHTLYVGWVMGIALSNGVDVEPVLDEHGNYTDRLSITFATHSDRLAHVTVVVPPPPADWDL